MADKIKFKFADPKTVERRMDQMIKEKERKRKAYDAFYQKKYKCSNCGELVGFICVSHAPRHNARIGMSYGSHYELRHEKTGERMCGTIAQISAQAPEKPEEGLW